MKRASKQKRLPVRYPSVPDRESDPNRYNEPALPVATDRAPSDRFQPGSTRADLRLQLEQLLRRKETVPEEAWAALPSDGHAVLVEMLDDEAVRSDEALLHRVISVVGQLSIKSGVVALSAILKDSFAQPVTRAYAANALGRIGEVAAVEALVVAAKVKDQMIRRQAVIALGRIDHESVLPHLLRLSKDESIAVAEVAVEAVHRRERKLGQRVGGKRKQSAARRTSTKKVRKRAPLADQP